VPYRDDSVKAFKALAIGRGFFFVRCNLPGWFRAPSACESVRGCIAYNRAPGPVHNASMLWIKAFHIVFVASWFAGLFYLPRLFVNLASVPPDSHAERERLLMMSRKLYRFASLLMVPAIGLGLWLWLSNRSAFGGGWLYVKLALVIMAIGYHHACRALLRSFEQLANTRSERWFRVFNESAVLIFTATVVLVVVKPF
jgi:protoporphyrinogen IX oxidase